MAKDKPKAKDEEPPEDNGPEHPSKYSGARVYEEALRPLVSLIKLYSEPDLAPIIQNAIHMMLAKVRASPDTIWADVPEAVMILVEPLTNEIADVFQDDPENWKSLMQVSTARQAGRALTLPTSQKFDGQSKMGPKGHHNNRDTLWYLCEAGVAGIARAESRGQQTPK